MTASLLSLDGMRAYKVPSEQFWALGYLVDGYDRMDLAAKFGDWKAVSCWGRDGWDLLRWPYYVLYLRNTEAGFEMATNCEGDTDMWRFPTEALRTEAVDQLAFWQWQQDGARWVAKPEGDISGRLTPENIPSALRGPYSRLDRKATL